MVFPQKDYLKNSKMLNEKEERGYLNEN